MEKRRDLFPVTRNLVYFNHAAVGPLSTIASEAMERFVRDQRDFGALHWRDWYAEYEKLRASAARLIGAADPREIAIVKNTSEGLSFVAEGYKWREGENVVTTAIEFPSNYTPWKRLERGWTNIERRGKFIGTSVDLLPDSRRFEAGSLNTNGIYGLRAAIDLLLDIGIEEIGREVIRIATRLADGLESIGLEVRTPRPIRSGIIGAAVSDGRELLRLHGELEKEGIICAPREGMLRFSPHFYNDESEVDRLIDALRSSASRAR